MRSLWTLSVFLGGLWIVSLLYGELLAFWIPRWSCGWPELEQNFASSKSLTDKPLRIVLIADPQLTDRTSYGMDPRSLALRLIQFYSDIYMRRAFRSTVLGLEPDEIIFLGDYFDGGPYLADDEWEESWKRFEHVFDQSQRGLKSRKIIPSYYLVGNHDLGYHEVFSSKPQIVQRYRKKFGETDFIHKVGSLDFVLVNSQALDGSRTDVFTNASWTFLEKLATSADHDARPKVLLTHIPLYRPDNTPCGPARASEVINQRLRRTTRTPGRVTYQNYLTAETSQKLLNLTKPVMVFSGHDHDQCKVTHTTPDGIFSEYTVGTFSWQQGNIYPSFMLLSVSRTSSAMTDTIVSEKLCFLPVQDFNYAWYGVLFVISILALCFWPSQGIDLWQPLRDLYNALKVSESVKAKDEDAEWEMLWDAEGGMHLVKKALPPSSTTSSQNYEQRGNAVQRAAAKSKATTPTDELANTDAVSSLPPSNSNRFGRRLTHMVGPLTLLLTVNFSLYMILVMKDWT